jgi:hypothetical protein
MPLDHSRCIEVAAASVSAALARRVGHVAVKLPLVARVTFWPAADGRAGA